MLELPESGRHDEVLKSVVAHNARRRAQRQRADRNRQLARIASRVGVLVACGVGAYALVVVASNLFGGGKSNAPTAAATPSAATSPAPTSHSGNPLGGLSLPTATPKPPAIAKHVGATKTVQHHAAKTTKTTKTKVRAKQPATASIASIPTTKPAKQHTSDTRTKRTPKKPTTASSSAQAVVLAEADAAKGTRATSLDATIPDPTVATFSISATRGPGFVEVRLKTRSGPLLTKGKVPKGETITFTGKLLWVEVAPQNLDLSVNGKPWRPSGASVVATLSPTGAHR